MEPDNIEILKPSVLFEKITPLVFLTIDWKLIFCGDWAIKATEVKMNKTTNSNIDLFNKFFNGNDSTLLWLPFPGRTTLAFASAKRNKGSKINRRFIKVILLFLIMMKYFLFVFQGDA